MIGSAISLSVVTVVLFIILVQAIDIVDAATPSTIGADVDLGYATYRGLVHVKTGNLQFLGIRFARAPIGSFLTYLASRS